MPRGPPDTAVDICIFMCFLYVQKRVDVSIMVMCCAGDIIEYVTQ